mmetsp:Transcript_5710/g.17506  ORF Transcript_5710/g.17506 Transcript_5710/m.17506 type:complete len:89 (-) Transcript_5710:157-423(-)
MICAFSEDKIQIGLKLRPILRQEITEQVHAPNVLLLAQRKVFWWKPRLTCKNLEYVRKCHLKANFNVSPEAVDDTSPTLKPLIDHSRM